MSSTEAVTETAGCARCGSCCDPVIMEADMLLACNARARAEVNLSPHAAQRENDVFLTQHWHPEGAFRDPDGTSVLLVRCDMFDKESRLCGAGDDRPPVCRRFPWYGDAPGPGRAAALPGHCSYLADVSPEDRPEGSRPLIPLTVLGAA